MKIQITLLLLISTLLACQPDGNPPASFDNLESIGVLGRWEITDEVMNGVADLLPKCCEFLEFIPNDNIGDYKGFLTYTDSNGFANKGTFEVDIANQTILFIEDDNDEFTFEFTVDDPQANLTIEFTENGADFTQRWIRVD